VTQWFNKFQVNIFTQQFGSNLPIFHASNRKQEAVIAKNAQTLHTKESKKTSKFFIKGAVKRDGSGRK
jgi:hypothetical protein